MRGHSVSSSRKFNRHWQSASVLENIEAHAMYRFSEYDPYIADSWGGWVKLDLDDYELITNGQKLSKIVYRLVMPYNANIKLETIESFDTGYDTGFKHDNSYYDYQINDDKQFSDNNMDVRAGFYTMPSSYQNIGNELISQYDRHDGTTYTDLVWCIDFNGVLTNELDYDDIDVTFNALVNGIDPADHITVYIGCASQADDAAATSIVQNYVQSLNANNCYMGIYYE